MAPWREPTSRVNRGTRLSTWPLACLTNVSFWRLISTWKDLQLLYVLTTCRWLCIVVSIMVSSILKPLTLRWWCLLHPIIVPLRLLWSCGVGGSSDKNIWKRASTSVRVFSDMMSTYSVIARQTVTALVPILRCLYSSTEGILPLSWTFCSTPLIWTKKSIWENKRIRCSAKMWVTLLWSSSTELLTLGIALLYSLSNFIETPQQRTSWNSDIFST